MSITIAKERADSPDAGGLVNELEAHLATRYPVESRHGFAVERLVRDGVAFFVARVEGAPAGCGGVLLVGADANGGPAFGELKRMYVRPAYRGRGVGRRLLEHLADHARRRGVNLLRLETGVHQAEAIALYTRFGFRRIDPFPPYHFDPVSLCFEMPLE